MRNGRSQKTGRLSGPRFALLRSWGRLRRRTRRFPPGAGTGIRQSARWRLGASIEGCPLPTSKGLGKPTPRLRLRERFPRGGALAYRDGSPASIPGVPPNRLARSGRFERAALVVLGLKSRFRYYSAFQAFPGACSRSRARFRTQLTITPCNLCSGASRIARSLTAAQGRADPYTVF
jgi:hypothetical protein